MRKSECICVRDLTKSTGSEELVSGENWGREFGSLL
jgi:hypothetical protein